MSGDIEIKHIYYKPLSHSDDQLRTMPCNSQKIAREYSEKP